MLWPAGGSREAREEGGSERAGGTDTTEYLAECEEGKRTLGMKVKFLGNRRDFESGSE